MIRFIIIGIIQGAVIGLIALGIVLVYKGSRVFNFAQAEFGTLGGFMLYMFHAAIGVPYLVAIVAAIALVGVFGFIMERLVVRPLFNAPRVTLLVATMTGFKVNPSAFPTMQCSQTSHFCAKDTYVLLGDCDLSPDQYVTHPNYPNKASSF